RIKSPVEYVLGAVQAVYRPYRESDANYRPLPQQTLVGWLGGMGQKLFAPPNVKGWPGGRSWLNTSTVLERDNFAAALAVGTLWGASPTSSQETAGKDAAPPLAFDPARLLHDEVGPPDEVVRILLDLYVPGGVPPEARAKLVTFVAQGNSTEA